MAWRASVDELLVAARYGSERTFVLESMESVPATTGPAATVTTHTLTLINASLRQDVALDVYIDGTVGSYESVEHGCGVNLISFDGDGEYPEGEQVTLKVTSLTHAWRWAVLELVR